MVCVAAWPWMLQLKRVSSIAIETCGQCGEVVKVIACIEDPAVIEKISRA
jgi:hypothetical protein